MDLPVEETRVRIRVMDLLVEDTRVRIMVMMWVRPMDVPVEEIEPHSNPNTDSRSDANPEHILNNAGGEIGH